MQQKQLQIIGSMISLTSLLQKNAKCKLKETVSYKQNKQHSHTRFNSLKLIDYPSDRQTKTVPFQFNSNNANTLHPLRQSITDRNNIKQKNVAFQKTSIHREVNLLGFDRVSNKKKLPFFEDIDKQLNHFTPKNQPIQDQYLRVCYQKLALQSYLSTITHQNITLTRQFSRR